MNYFPKISIVTPSFNDVKFLEITILSVIKQEYPNLEYIIIDGGSTDGSVDIIKKYEKHLSYWVSEKDEGMYYAIQKGFERSTGEIMGWINSDDILHPRSLFTVGQIFADHHSVNWLQGFPNTIDETGRIVAAISAYDTDKLFFYERRHIKSYKYIQQESTFWRRALWDIAGSKLSIKYKYAGDFELWIRFFRYAKLYNIYALIGSFRLSSSGQASVDNYKTYVKETLAILAENPLSVNEKIKLFLRRIGRIADWVPIIFSKIIAFLHLDHKSVLNQKFQFNYKEQKFK